MRPSSATAPPDDDQCENCENLRGLREEWEKLKSPQATCRTEIDFTSRPRYPADPQMGFHGCNLPTLVVSLFPDSERGFKFGSHFAVGASDLSQMEVVDIQFGLTVLALLELAGPALPQLPAKGHTSPQCHDPVPQSDCPCTRNRPTSSALATSLLSSSLPVLWVVRVSKHADPELPVTIQLYSRMAVRRYLWEVFAAERRVFAHNWLEDKTVKDRSDLGIRSAFLVLGGINLDMWRMRIWLLVMAFHLCLVKEIWRAQ